MSRKDQLMVSSKWFLLVHCKVGENERKAGFSFEQGTNFWLITNTSTENRGKIPTTALCALLLKQRTDIYTMFLREILNKADQIRDNYSDISTYFEWGTINAIMMLTQDAYK